MEDRQQDASIYHLGRALQTCIKVLSFKISAASGPLMNVVSPAIKLPLSYTQDALGMLFYDLTDL